MSNGPLALVADDQHLGRAIQALLQERLYHPAPLRPFEAARQNLGTHPGGLLVCAASSGEDAGQLMHLVQEVCLRQWPATVLVVEAGEAALNCPLACLDSYVVGRLRWPE